MHFWWHGDVLKFIDFCIGDADGRGVRLGWVFGWLVDYVMPLPGVFGIRTALRCGEMQSVLSAELELDSPRVALSVSSTWKYWWRNFVPGGQFCSSLDGFL